MRLSSSNAGFIFSYPKSFIPKDISDTYQPILEKNWIQYEDVVDYLSSTIKSVNFPGLSIDLPKQIMHAGKVRNFKPATNVQDIITTRELSVNMRSVDQDLNYWIMFDIFTKHYLDTTTNYVNPFTITCVDIHRDVIYVIKFYELILKSLSDNTFNYSQQKVNAKEFTLTFNFNFYEVEFLLDKSKVLDLGDIPKIINRK